MVRIADPKIKVKITQRAPTLPLRIHAKGTVQIINYFQSARENQLWLQVQSLIYTSLILIYFTIILLSSRH